MKTTLKSTLLITVLACLAVAGCGKKGDLLPPPQRESAPPAQNAPVPNNP